MLSLTIPSRVSKKHGKPLKSNRLHVYSVRVLACMQYMTLSDLHKCPIFVNKWVFRRSGLPLSIYGLDCGPARKMGRGPGDVDRLSRVALRPDGTEQDTVHDDYSGEEFD
jgi:hypothetical protein